MIVHIEGYISSDCEDPQDLIPSKLDFICYISFRSIEGERYKIGFSKRFSNIDNNINDSQLNEFVQALEDLDFFTLTMVRCEVSEFEVIRAFADRASRRLRYNAIIGQWAGAGPSLNDNNEDNNSSEGQTVEDNFSDGKDYPEITKESVSIEEFLENIDKALEEDK